MLLARPARRLATGCALTAAALLALALPAAAHVTINPRSAEPGGFAAFDVRVPNEEPDAATTKVELNLPTDHPIPSVSVRPLPGWKIKVVKGKLPKPVTTDDGELTEAVTQITWSGGKIEPGQFQHFGISLGPLPTDTDKLYFTALQTYTGKDGKTTTVRWEEMPSGGAEPEHPAPSITLAKPAADTEPATPTAPTAPTAGSGPATAIAITGLVVALLALGTALVSLRRRPPAG